MNKFTKILLATTASVVALGLVHARINLGWFEETKAAPPYRVGFLPVT